MIVVSVAGDPEAISAYLTTLIGSGRKILHIKKAKLSTKYVIIHGP